MKGKHYQDSPSKIKPDLANQVEQLVRLRKPFEHRQPDVAIGVEKIKAELLKQNYWMTPDDIESYCDEYFDSYYSCNWMDIKTEQMIKDIVDYITANAESFD